MAPLRACIERGCPFYTNGTRCEKHQREYDATRESKRTGSSGAWKRIRLECFARDRFTCQVCGHRAVASELEAHHLDENRENHVLSNLATVHALVCHDAVHRELRRKKKKAP